MPEELTVMQQGGYLDQIADLETENDLLREIITKCFKTVHPELYARDPESYCILMQYIDTGRLDAFRTRDLAAKRT